MANNDPGYIPHPIETSGIVIPEELLGLCEELSRNVHEVWAKGRMEEGWTFGKERDALNKKHPSIVSYDELSESEKDYDRRTSQETIKMILALGFKIERKTSE